MRRLKLFEVLSDVLMPDRHHTLLALVRFLYAFLSLEWLMHSSAKLLEQIGPWLAPLWGGPALEHGWAAEGLLEMVGPGLLFGVAVAWIWAAKILYGRRHRKPEEIFGKPARSRGIVASLSTYRGNSSPLADVAAVKAAAERALASGGLTELGELRKNLLASNWGPLCAAAQYHGATLTHCWLICTLSREAPQAGGRGSKGSMDEYPAACQALSALLGKDVHYTPMPLADVSSIEAAAELVQKIYDAELPEANLEEKEVVADLTGGTAAMSAGMVLATLPSTRRLEYLRQGVDISVLTEAQIEQQNVLVEVRAGADMVARERNAAHGAGAGA